MSLPRLGNATLAGFPHPSHSDSKILIIKQGSRNAVSPTTCNNMMSLDD